MVQVSVSADALTRTPQGQRSLVDFQFFAQSDGMRDGVFELHAVELMFPAARLRHRDNPVYRLPLIRPRPLPVSVSLRVHKRSASAGSIAHGITPSSSVESAATGRAISQFSQ